MLHLLSVIPEKQVLIGFPNAEFILVFLCMSNCSCLLVHSIYPYVGRECECQDRAAVSIVSVGIPALCFYGDCFRD